MATAPDEINPFRAPTAAIGVPTPFGATPDAEAIRLIHLRHEARIKLDGALAYVAAGFLLVMTALNGAMAAGLLPGFGDDPSGALMQRLMIGVTAVVCLVGALVCGGVGFGLRRLQAWARWVTLVLAVLGAGYMACCCGLAAIINARMAGIIAAVLAVPILFLGWVIYTMLAPPAGVVFSPEYRAIVRQTPHLRYRRGAGFKLLVGLLVGLVAFFAILALVGG